ncbi:MAG: hypothetical protein RIT14_649 [Pseudomonadota bacterium]|jgi:branched-chain amino acid transport system permease protein
MFTHTPLRLTTLALLALGALGYALVAGFFGLEILAEIAILAILVIALDLVAGFGGMVSLCHGALLGVGAYAFTLAASDAGLTALPAMGLAIALSAALAFVIGAVCARSTGIYFIMATLAFGQMAYSFVFQSPLFGGDDGLSGAPRPDLSLAGIDLNDSRAFAVYAVLLVVLAYLVAAATLRSGLGRSLVGLHHNEKRLRALGLTVWRAKATAFAISGALAGLAGCLAAQHTQYISPGLLSWTVSGEALVVVILGGLGTLVGPILGAILFVVLKHEISAITPYWHAIVGLILIAVVMSRAQGVFGFLEARMAARKSQPLITEVKADA